MRTFAVGDIHGWAATLGALLERLRPMAAPGDTLLFIGDYIDRGPESRQVVDLVLEERARWLGPVVTLKGNHEANLLEALNTGSVRTFAEWIFYGQSKATIGNYTHTISLASFQENLPAEHREFFNGLQLWHEDEHAIYVHAGLTPGLSPAECTEHTLLWIREEFINSRYAWPKPVVFGHTPQNEVKLIAASKKDDGFRVPLRQTVWRPLDRPEKIGIDTGRAYGGPLTAVIMPEREFISVGP